MSRIESKDIVEKICFVHLPKCGGLSFSKTLMGLYGAGHYVRFDSHKAIQEARKLGETPNVYREKCLNELLADPFNHCVSGHYRCSARTRRRFEDEWRFITLLRDPVDRWFSNYFYNRFKSDGMFKHSTDLASYIDSDRGRSMGSIYTRMLSAHRDPTSEQAIDETIANLKGFTLVGVLERGEDWQRRFEARFGPKIELPVVNANPDPSGGNYWDEIEPDVIEEVRRICLPDRLVYDAFASAER
ncbi:MAG: sulfotransferase family 2 domain-containing protein [Pseudomonadota bacterium]